MGGLGAGGVGEPAFFQIRVFPEVVSEVHLLRRPFFIGLIFSVLEVILLVEGYIFYFLFLTRLQSLGCLAF